MKKQTQRQSKYKPEPNFLRDNIQHMDRAQRFELTTEHTVRVGRYIADLKDYWQAQAGGKFAGSFVSPEDAIDKLEAKLLED